jgi:hypothetical protein
MIAPLIYEALKDDDDIVEALATFEGQPAIFTTHLPEDCPFPAILINEVGGGDFGTRGDVGGVASIDVQVFDDKSLSKKAVRALAWQIRALLHRADLSTWADEAGIQVLSCLAEVPRNTNDGLGFPGFTVPVQVRFLGA